MNCFKEIYWDVKFKFNGQCLEFKIDNLMIGGNFAGGEDEAIAGYNTLRQTSKQTDQQTVKLQKVARRFLGVRCKSR